MALTPLRETRELPPFRPRPYFARSLICIPRKRISPGPFRVPLFLSPAISPHPLLARRMAALSLVETPRRE